MQIDIKYHTDIEPLEQHGNMIDLRVAEDVSMKAGEFKLISLGVSMKLPEGYYAEIVPRSSTFNKYKILQTNSIGIVDSEYCGNDDVWLFPALAIEDTFIAKGTRICQFRIVANQPEITFNLVDDLGHKNRGGFGTSG